MATTTKRKTTAAASAAAIAMAATLGYGFEGEKHRAYRDVVGVATYCIGETRNVDWNHTYTHKECMDKYEGRLVEFAAGVQKCTFVTLSDKKYAAFIDFSYNLGEGTYCKYIAPLVNAGQAVAACNMLLHFNHAGGRVYAGLTRRREAERTVCLEG